MKIGLAIVCLFTATYLQADTADAVLSRLDKASTTFQGASAKIQMKTHTAIIDDTTVESGTLQMQRLRPNDVRAVLDFSGQTDARKIGFFGSTVRIYYPNLKTYQDYDLGKNTDVLNQFLLLGFGSSGRELAHSYDVSSGGEEKIGDRDTTKLVLVPKDPEVAKRLSKIEMWIPSDAAYPVQQEFYEPSGNYRVVTYSDIVLNPKIKGRLELKLPSGVKKQGS